MCQFVVFDCSCGFYKGEIYASYFLEKIAVV